MVLVQLSIQVQLEVHQLCRAERNNDLALVRRCTNDGLASWYSPLVDSTVSKNVADTVRVNLKQRVGADLLDSKCWGGGKEAGVLNFLDCLPNGQDERSVDER